MHEHRTYHGKLHGENVLIRTVNGEEKLCLVDFGYTNLCPRDAIKLLVNESPSFCGKVLYELKGNLIIFCLCSSRNSSW